MVEFVYSFATFRKLFLQKNIHLIKSAFCVDLFLKCLMRTCNVQEESMVNTIYVISECKKLILWGKCDLPKISKNK